MKLWTNFLIQSSFGKSPYSPFKKIRGIQTFFEMFRPNQLRGHLRIQQWGDMKWEKWDAMWQILNTLDTLYL